MPQRIKIYFRQMQLQYDINNDGIDENVVAAYDNVLGIAKYVAGNVPKSTWEEMTDYCEGQEKLSLSWNKINQASKGGTTNEGGSNYDKGITETIEFWGKAFDYIWDWMLEENWQMLNAVEVLITDAICGKSFRTFEIKSDNIKYSPSEECRFEIGLREQDLKWHAVHKTFIFDDWQHWFNTKADGVKDHPTFLTCIEPRPRILSSVRTGLHLFLSTIPFISYVLLPDEDDDMFRKIAGLNKFHQAPLIRDYITNVCDKYGLGIDTIFHDPANPYYNLCAYFPSSGFFNEFDGWLPAATDMKFNFENRWLITLAELLDKLRTVFEAEWYVTPNDTVVFKPTKDLINVLPIYDFTSVGAFKITDESKLTYTFNGNKKAAYGRYQYTPDGSDLGSQEIAPLYNDIVDYDGPANNPMLEGEKTKINEFAPTAFMRDGRVPNYAHLLANDGETVAYILIAILAVVVIALLGGVLSAAAGGILLATFVLPWLASIASRANHLRSITDDPIYYGAVRLVAEQAMTPRLLLWDGESMSCAKVVSTTAPAPSNYYNPDSTAYTTLNKIAEDNPGNKIFNYPMYFDSMFSGNLYDRFHDVIDNPLKSLENNQTFEFNVPLCCEMMDLLGCWDGSFTKVGYLIKIEDRTNYEVFGRIEDIDVHYDGFTITIKGKVIKKKK